MSSSSSNSTDGDDGPNPERDAKKIDELIRNAYPEEIREELNGLDALVAFRSKQRSGDNGDNNNNGNGGGNGKDNGSSSSPENNNNGNGKRRKSYGGSSTDEKRNSAEAKELLGILKAALKSGVTEDGDTKEPPPINSLIDLLIPLVLSRLDLITIFQTGEILYYQDGVYQNGGEQMIDSELELIAEEVGKPYKINIACKTEIRRHIRDSTYASRDDFDSDKNILNCKNGLLNVFTLEFTPHTPAFLSMIQIPVSYNPHAVCLKISDFLRTSLDPFDMKKAVKMLGDILIPDYRYKAVYFFVGSGNNGKGVLGRLIKALVGEQNAAGIRLKALADNRFMVARLRRKMVNFAGDINADSIEDWALIRSLSGNDVITGEDKGKDPDEFVNRATLIFAFNKLPETDNEKSTMTRLVLLTFDKTFDVSDDFEEKMHTQEELSGLLNLALVGVRLLKRDKGFSETSWIETRQEYLAKQNPVAAFVKDRLIIDYKDEKAKLSTEEVQVMYIDYCKEKGIPPIDNRELGKRLADLGIENERDRKKRSTGHYYLFVKRRVDTKQTIL